MARIVSRDDLAGSLEVGADGADNPEAIFELAERIRTIDTENVQISETDGIVVIARAEDPPVDGEPV